MMISIRAAATESIGPYKMNVLFPMDSDIYSPGIRGPYTYGTKERLEEIAALINSFDKRYIPIITRNI